MTLKTLAAATCVAAITLSASAPAFAQADIAQRLAELLVAAAEEWGHAPEQADDMTVVVARLA